MHTFWAMNNNLQANFRSNKNFDKGNLTRFFVCDVIFDSSNQLLPLSVKSISLSNRVVLLLSAWNKWWFLSKSCEVLITEVEKECHWNIRSRHANLSCLSGMRKKKMSFHERIFWNAAEKCKFTSSAFGVYQDRKPERLAYSINASFAKPFVEERRKKFSCKPQKNLKENASEKSRFLQKCTFYCFSLSFLQALIKA